MQSIHTGQQVTYVAPIDKVGGKPTKKKAVVLEVLVPGKTVRLDFTPRNDKGEAADPKKAPLGHNTAIAEFDDSEEPKENTFHFTPADESAPDAQPTAPATTTAKK